MISSVSFAGTQGASSSFEEKIRQPQTYMAKESPQAAAKIKEKGGKKGSVGKTILKIAAAAAAILGGLALVSKTGVLKINPEGNAVVNTIKTGINTAGSFVCDKVSGLAGKIIPAAEEHIDEVI